MHELLRQYRRTHHGQYAPLLEIQRHVRLHGPPDADAIRMLAERVRLPESAVRAASTYYADLREPPGALRVCAGTSCVLAGAERRRADLENRVPCRAVHCLGYCDRSPVVLRDDDRIVLGENDVPDDTTPDPPPPPDIRCAAAQAIVTSRIGRGDFSALSTARTDGAYEALRAAVQHPPDAVIEAVERSGQRGRGGAAYPVGRKWRICAETPAEQRYVIANGDEGDPGSFIDRLLMESDPHGVLEGLALCAYAVGARRGYVFIRSEYPEAFQRMQRAIQDAIASNLLGPEILGTDFSFDVTVFPGMGSFVCGEETAMLNTIEGLRGEVRIRPPYPAQSGLDGQPTVVDNVESLVNVPWIITRGGDAFAALGTDESSGTKAICLNHGFARPGIVEIEFGHVLEDVIRDLAGGGRDGALPEAVILGGPMGSIVGPEEWSVPICYGEMRRRGLEIGHGGMVALPRDTDYHALLVHWLRFMREESCGRCVPCGLGSARAHDLALDASDRPALQRLLEVMADASLCAFGQRLPHPVQQILDRFGDRIFGPAREDGP